MRIIRGPRDHGFVIIPNDTLEDARLSFRARGVLAYLLSRPDGWTTNSDTLAAGAREGRDAIRTALRELEQARYMTRTKTAGERGQWVTVTVVTDRPQVGDQAVHNLPDDGLPGVGQPGAGIPGAVSKTESKNPPTPPGAGSCATHRDTPVPRCRGCGTSPRQLRAAAATWRPPHCGTCDPDTRMLHDAEDRPYRCPRCHPLVVTA